MIDSPVNFAPYTDLGQNRTAMRSILFLCVLGWTFGGGEEVLKRDMSNPWRDAVAYRMPDDPVTESFLTQLDDEMANALWRTTEAGFADDTEDDCLFPDSIRMDLEMELLEEVTDLAWSEAKESI